MGTQAFRSKFYGSGLRLLYGHHVAGSRKGSTGPTGFGVSADRRPRLSWLLDASTSLPPTALLVFRVPPGFRPPKRPMLSRLARRPHTRGPLAAAASSASTVTPIAAAFTSTGAKGPKESEGPRPERRIVFRTRELYRLRKHAAIP